MKEQSEPTASDEWLVRRIHRKDIYGDPPKVSLYAFKPIVDGKFPDDTGISLYRHDCLETVEQALRKVPPEKSGNYGIALLSVKFIRSIGLTIVPEDDEEEPIIPGHVVLREINSKRYKSDKDYVLALMDKLARHVNESNKLI